MIQFTNLYFDLTAIQHRTKRIERLRSYFNALTDERDRYWAQLLLTNTNRFRLIEYNELRTYASDFTGLPLWLIEESVRHTGNVTEAITLIVTSQNATANIPLHEIMGKIHTLNKYSYNEKSQFIQSVWITLPKESVLLFNKLITAGYRSPISGSEFKELSNSEDVSSRPLYTIKAVLLYASPAEYTFAVWKDDLLVPLVKTTLGMKPEDHLYIRKFVVKNTREQFGPVHSINPELVFEIGFEDIEPAPRRKSGVKLISPQILRRCDNAGPEDIDQLDVLRSMLAEK